MPEPFKKTRVAGRHALLLRGTRLLRGPLAALGIDYPTLHTLLDLRFTIDFRSRAEGGKTGAALGGVGATLFMSLFMGTIFALSGLSAHTVSGLVALLAASILFYGSFLSLTIFADLLFDRPLETLLATAPIDGRTALAARLLPPAIYLLLIDAAIAVPQIIGSAIRFGAGAAIPGGILTTLLSSWLSIDVAMLAFAMTLRFVRPERFKVIVVRLQIGLTLLMMLGPQVFQFGGGSLMRRLGSLDLGLWTLLFPPTWYGDLVSLMVSGARTQEARSIAGAALAILIPIAAMALAFRLAKERFLSSMIASVTEEGLEHRVRTMPSTTAWFAPRDVLERAGFDLCIGLQLRESGSLLRIAPMLVFPLIYMMPMIRGSDGSFGDRWPLIAYGFAATMVPLVNQLRFSDTPLAAWIVDTAPDRAPARLLSGALRASVVRFVLLPGILVTAIAGATNGISGFLDGATGTAAAVAIGSAIGRAAAPRITPFSVMIDPKAIRGSLGWQLLIMALMMIAAAVHRSIEHSLGLVLALLVVWTLLAVVAYRGSSRIVFPVGAED